MPTLKSLREARGLSQQELADKIGVQRNTVARWEMEETEDGSNSIRPRGPAHRLLGMIFNIDPDTIVYGPAPEQKERA